MPHACFNIIPIYNYCEKKLILYFIFVCTVLSVLNISHGMLALKYFKLETFTLVELSNNTFLKRCVFR